MTRAKTIKLYLMDGESTGRIKCSIAYWTGIVYKIPRTSIDNCKNIRYLNQSGVYFLFGTDKDYNQIVYVGQAGSRKNGKGLLLRIQEAHNQIDWTEAVLFTTTDNSFGPTEISYLEHRFCELAKAANRYQVRNGNDPNPGNTTEEATSELEDFIDNAKLVMGALGHKVFEPLIPQTSDAEENQQQLLHMSYKKAHASGRRTNDGFVIFKGSTICPSTTPTCPKNVLLARQQYADKINNNELTDDILMSSPSAAAGFVGGASLSGNVLWKEHNDADEDASEPDEE